MISASTRIAVLICADPPLSANKPDRISSRVITFSFTLYGSSAIAKDVTLDRFHNISLRLSIIRQHSLTVIIGSCQRRQSMNRYIAELLGTFVLVFASCGSAVLAGDKIGFLGVSLAFGLSLLAMIYAIGPISGCHINPAVTVGLLMTGKVDAKFAPGYIAA